MLHQPGSAICVPSSGRVCCGCSGPGRLLEALNPDQAEWVVGVKVSFGCLTTCGACSPGSPEIFGERSLHLPTNYWNAVNRVYALQAADAKHASSAVFKNVLHRAVANYLTSQNYSEDASKDAELRDALMTWLPDAVNQWQGKAHYLQSAETYTGYVVDGICAKTSYIATSLVSLGFGGIEARPYAGTKAATVSYGSVQHEHARTQTGKKVFVPLEAPGAPAKKAACESTWYSLLFGEDLGDRDMQYPVEVFKEGSLVYSSDLLPCTSEKSCGRYGGCRSQSSHFGSTTKYCHNCSSPGLDPSQRVKTSVCDGMDESFRDFLIGQSVAYVPLTDKLASMTVSFPPGAVIQKSVARGQLSSYDIVMSEKGPIAVLSLGDDSDIIARRIGPDLTRVQGFTSSIASVSNAFQRRYVDKHVAMSINRNTRSRLTKFVKELIDVVFSPEAIQKWRMENPLMEILRSPNLTLERFNQVMDDMFKGLDVDLEKVKKLIIKLEVGADKGEDGKPRLIMNDGAENQIAALLVAKCIEDLWFHGTEDHVKHVRREEALCKFIKESQRLGEGATFIGGDGASWDFSISNDLRNMIENPIFDHVCDHLHRHLNDDTHDGAAKKFSQGKKAERTRVKVDTKDTKKKGVAPPSAWVDFLQIRRSGDRLTSTFNQMVNSILWHVTLFESPLAAMMRPLDRHALLLQDAKGNPIKTDHLCCARAVKRFEGDDSALGLVFFDNKGHVYKPSTSDARDHIKRVITSGAGSLWRAFGFNMTLEWAFEGDKFTFIGVDMLVGKTGLANCYVPEILRALGTVAWSTSPDIIAQGVDSPIGRQIAYASFMARACSFAAYEPLSRFFEAMAAPYADRAFAHADASLVVTREVAYKLGVLPGTEVNMASHVGEVRSYLAEQGVLTSDLAQPDGIRALVAASAGAVTVEEESLLLAVAELHRDAPWAGDYLPASWRTRIRPTYTSFSCLHPRM